MRKRVEHHVEDEYDNSTEMGKRGDYAPPAGPGDAQDDRPVGVIYVPDLTALSGWGAHVVNRPRGSSAPARRIGFNNGD